MHTPHDDLEGTEEEERGGGSDRGERGGAERAHCGPGRHRHRRHRKARVLHTRISEPLAEDIRRLADDLRVPVSNLVRNVLEEAFSVVETVTDNVGDLIEDVVDEAERTRQRIQRHRGRRRQRHRRWTPPEPPEPPAPVETERAEYPEVIGWQPLILNQTRQCADCEETLERGERAFAGLSATGLSARTLCRDCMDARR